MSEPRILCAVCGPGLYTDTMITYIARGDHLTVNDWRHAVSLAFDGVTLYSSMKQPLLPLATIQIKGTLLCGLCAGEYWRGGDVRRLLESGR